MRTRAAILFAICLALPVIASPFQQQGERGPDVPSFWVRPGYKVTKVTGDLEHARFVEFDDKGNLYLSRPNKNDILMLKKKGDRFEVAGTFVADRPTAHGMCWADGWLYFSQTGAIHRARDENGDGKADKIETVIAEGSLPKAGGHWWRSITVSADAIYTGIGDSGNANDDDASADSMTKERQKIWKFGKDGTGKALFASGIRNTEKLQIRPGTNEVWGIEHGTEKIGKDFGETDTSAPISDVQPVEEFNHFVEGGFYGHPYLDGNRFPRPEFAKRPDLISLAQKTIIPAWSLPAHYSGTGWTFLKKGYFSPDHSGDAFIACKGSSGKVAEKVGYCVERVLFDKLTGKPYGNWKVVGTLVDGKVLARPTDCAEAPDGTVVFTDEVGKCIYMISKSGR